MRIPDVKWKTEQVGAEQMYHIALAQQLAKVVVRADEVECATRHIGLVSLFVPDSAWAT